MGATVTFGDEGRFFKSDTLFQGSREGSVLAAIGAFIIRKVGANGRPPHSVRHFLKSGVRCKDLTASVPEGYNLVGLHRVAHLHARRAQRHSGHCKA